MKILQVCKYFYPIITGVTVYVHNLSRELAKLGHTVTVLTYGDQAGEETIDDIQVVRVPWHSRRKILHSINGAQPDLVHTHGIWEHSILAAYAAKKLKIPYYVTIHGTWMFLKYSDEFNSLRKYIKYYVIYRQILWRLALQQASGVIVLNRDEEEDVIKLGVRADTVFRIPNGTDPRTFIPDRGGEAKKALGLPDKPVVLLVGALQKQKGILTLLQAASVLKENQIDVQFAFCGDGPDRLRTKQWVRERGLDSYVRFTGQIDRESILRYYQASDIFVLPSLRETFGTVFLEAMACALPCIGTNDGGTPDIIIHGETGYLIEPGDSKDLACKIEGLCNTPKLARDLGDKGRKRVEEFFSWPVISKKILMMYESRIR